MPDASVSAGQLRQFVRDETELSISYVDLEDRRTNRRIKPLALIYYIDAVLLAAWCELRQDFRHFRINRIAACNATGGGCRRKRCVTDTVGGAIRTTKLKEWLRISLGPIRAAMSYSSSRVVQSFPVVFVRSMFRIQSPGGGCCARSSGKEPPRFCSTRSHL